ncbi:MAG: hypothetical protein J6X55_08560 [Victivallales bacterium]|nr:hypothetical protein [Victivallales bacterium]
MEIRNKFNLFLGAAALVLLTGCASDKLVAMYTLPAAGINVKNMSDISPMNIVVKVKASGNVPVNCDAAAEQLMQQVASEVYLEKNLKVTDIVWGDMKGGQKVSDVFAKHNSMHGYARYVTDAVKAAMLELDVAVKLDNSTVEKSREYILQTVPYRRKYTEKGMPYSEEVTERIQKQKTVAKYNVLVTKGKGIVAARLVDKDGREVYRKAIPISLSFENSLEKHDAPLTANAMISLMSLRAINTVIGDISPHQESQELKANEKGNKKGVLLLKAQAFAEAATFLENLDAENDLTNKKTDPADLENLGLAYEILGDYAFAEEAYKRGNCTDRLKKLGTLKAKKGKN